MKICAVLIFIIIVFTILPINADSNTPVTYKAYIDNEYGFYKVRDITTYKPAPLVGRTLTINVGDTVIWESDMSLDKKLTLVSEQNLWNNADAYIKGSHTFNYVFMTSGTYNIYIKEYPKLRQYIVVKDSIVPTVSPTVTITPVPTTIIVIQTTSPVHTPSLLNDEKNIDKRTIIVGQRIFIMLIIAFVLSVSLVWVLVMNKT